MGIAYENCRWCKGRPGGCLHCVEERELHAKMEIVREMSIAREQFVLDGLAQGAFRLLRFTEIVERRDGFEEEFHSDGVQTISQPSREHSRRGALRTATPYHVHQFVYEPPQFQRRHCVCGLRQVFRWLPESATQNGEWVEEEKLEVKEKPARLRRYRKTKSQRINA